MQLTAEIEGLSRVIYRHESAVKKLEKIREDREKAIEAAEAYSVATTVFTLLSDRLLTSFRESLCSVANSIISEAFGDGYQISIDPVGTTGFRVMVKEGSLVGSVNESQGGGFNSVASMALLLAALTLSDAVKSDFVLLDEPFGGTLAEDRLDLLYSWLAKVSEQLGIQIIMTTHHKSALDHATTVIQLEE